MPIPKDQQTTTAQSDRLPSYLQSLHHIRPARPSMVSQELGSDALGRTQNTWKPPDQSSLHNVCRTRISSKPMQNLIFFKRQICRSHAEGAPRGRQTIGDAPCACELRSVTVSLNTNRFGGAERDRTADPLLAKQVLSQLSYSPSSSITQGQDPKVRQQSASPDIPSSLTLICKCKWWAREDLNFRPHAYQACALTN